jgi:hypothetical protein
MVTITSEHSMVAALERVVSRDVASMVVVTFKVRAIVIGGTTTWVGCGDTSIPATFGVGSSDD